MEKNTFEQIVDEVVASSSPTELPVMEAKMKMGTKSPSPFTIARVVDEVCLFQSLPSSPPFAAARVYKELKIKYGKPSGQWKLWCKRPKSEEERTEVIIGAVLTQRTNWKNVQLAIDNLKKAKICSLKKIHRLTVRRLGLLIKPCGFYQTKAGYLLNLAKFIIKNYGSVAKIKKQNAEKLRKELLKIKGIGPETADSILLYGLDKPVFVVDEYTRRLVGQRTFVLFHPSLRSGKKRKLSKNLSYDFLQKLFEKNLKRDFRLYQDFHALIVIDGKNK